MALPKHVMAEEVPSVVGSPTPRRALTARPPADSPDGEERDTTSPRLSLVATPIGNLGDITVRALETLRRVDVIASEDTRKTATLLARYDIHKPQVAFHAYNEARVLPYLLRLHAEGKSIALVSDAGTPGISDPGYSLVREAIASNLPITALPGPSAVLLALVLSGLPAHSFTYRGFPPRRRGPRRRFLEVDRLSPHTLVFYESPHRLLATLEDGLAVLGDRPAAIGKDLTKRFETMHRGSLAMLLERLRPLELRGEYTLVIAGAGYEPGGEETLEAPATLPS